jgi:glutamyl-Q tRNA(Asp) synthetase
VSVARSSSATATTGTAEGVPRYRGRFAPTPSGELHFGSLIAAAGSFLDARAHAGEWHVRIEDLDRPRTRTGAAEAILRTLERYALEWDGPVLHQSRGTGLYEDALGRLRAAGRIRDCSCSRTDLKRLDRNRGRPPGDELFHPDQCLPAAAAAARVPTQRLRVPPASVEFEDRSLGVQVDDVANESGDFVLRRRDGYFAYQLAVVVDDAAQGVTDVVRGSDLLSSTARQILLQRALGLPAVRYLHLPLAVRADGTKLSKSADAPAVARATPADQAWQVLRFLGQQPPAWLRGAPPQEIWAWAIPAWKPSAFAGIRSRTPAGLATADPMPQDPLR